VGEEISNYGQGIIAWDFFPLNPYLLEVHIKIPTDEMIYYLDYFKNQEGRRRKAEMKTRLAKAGNCEAGYSSRDSYTWLCFNTSSRKLSTLVLKMTDVFKSSLIQSKQKVALWGNC
jgi:hypothetical protein